jgi:hypothetical protein
MNSRKEIERYLRAAPKPLASESLLDRLTQDITLPESTRDASSTSFGWFTNIINSLAFWRLTTAAGIALIVAMLFITRPRGPEGEEGAAGRGVHEDVMKAKAMAEARDVTGLASMVSEGTFEGKLLAANLLANMGDLPALATLSMHASGDLIIENRAGILVLGSVGAPDRLELNGSVFLVHKDESVQTASKVRITHDVSGDPDRWERRKREFQMLRQESKTLQEELANKRGASENEEQLRARLAKVNQFLDGLDEAVYATIDGARLILDCPLRRCQASAELAGKMVRVVESRGNVVEANSVTLLFDLRPVRTDGPPVPTEGWRSRFDQVYSLAEGEVLRWVRTPFIPERQIYATQEMHYYQSTDNPPPPGYMFFRFNGNVYNWAISMGECTLGSVLHTSGLGLNRYEYNDGPEELARLKLGGDWIVRDGTPVEERLRALESILLKELGRTIKFDKRLISRECIVVRGQYKHSPLEGVEHRDNIYIYPDSWEHLSGPEPVNGGGTRSLLEMMQMVGSHFDRPVIFETENGSDITVGYFTSQSYSLAIANTKNAEDRQEILDSVLRNLSAQTSLEFEYGQRDQTVWFITEECKKE